MNFRHTLRRPRDAAIGRSILTEVGYLTAMSLLVLSPPCGDAHAQEILRDRQLATRIEQAIPGYLSDTIGGAVLVARRGEVLYERAFGMAEVELGVPLTTSSIFQIGSLTKQFTAIAVLQLVEKGALSLEDSITRFLPDFPMHGHLITIENLLTHTSGIHDMTRTPEYSAGGSLRYSPTTPVVEERFIAGLPSDFEPGTRFEYSNSNYMLLGLIIERISGKSYEQYLNDNIFAPLGMSHAMYDHPETIVPGRAAGYVWDQRGVLRNAEYLDASTPYAAGGLLMTVGDMFTWHQALYANKLVSRVSLDRATTPFTLKNGSSTDYGYGFGLLALDSANVAIEHGGTISGFQTFALYFAKQDVYVVVFCNGLQRNAMSLSLLLGSLAANLPETKEIQISSTLMDDYVGQYQFENNSPSRIYRSNGKMYQRNAHATRPWQLHFLSDTEFYFDETFPQLSFFERDRTGKVISNQTYVLGKFHSVMRKLP
jgi:CubicO group peptidase (beta-lactamase class C family)